MQNISEFISSPSIDPYFLQARVRWDIINLMPNPPQKILECGCGIRRTGQVMFEKYKSQITGIDLSQKAIEVAKQQNCYQKLLVCDLDQNPVPSEIENERFDCIIYPDVLEHLKDPWQVLKEHLNLLQPDGIMIASIPNIRHIYILKELIFKGTWTYQKMGILDKTHLRFFTKKEMIHLFEQANMTVSHIESRSRSLSGPLLLKKIHRLFPSSFLEEFLTVQYLICASKK